MNISNVRPMALDIALAQARSYRADPALTNRSVRVTVALLREIERLQAALNSKKGAHKCLRCGAGGEWLE